MNCRLDVLLADATANEAAKMRKLEIIFGPWWRHYAVPYEFPATLYLERNACPYCGRLLGPLSISVANNPNVMVETAQLDHMDPISGGGEDSIRNTVYVCRSCNSSKGSRLFVNWLKKLPVELATGTYQLYLEKHGHPPEAFVPRRRQARLTLPRLELSLEEGVLRHLFPKPIVSGPPQGDIYFNP